MSNYEKAFLFRAYAKNRFWPSSFLAFHNEIFRIKKWFLFLFHIIVHCEVSRLCWLLDVDAARKAIRLIWQQGSHGQESSPVLSVKLLKNKPRISYGVSLIWHLNVWLSVTEYGLLVLELLSLLKTSIWIHLDIAKCVSLQWS